MVNPKIYGQFRRGRVPNPKRAPIAVGEVFNLADAVCKSNSKIYHSQQSACL